MRNLFSVAALAVASLTLVGCSDGGPTGTVSGTVTQGGQGIPAQVTFKGDTASVSGVSDDSGKFTLSTGTSEQIPVGTYQVAVSEVSAPADMDDAEYAKMMEGGGNMPAPTSTIPRKYQGFGTSGLEFEVTEGENSFDIPLE